MGEETSLKHFQGNEMIQMYDLDSSRVFFLPSMNDDFE